MVCLPILRVIFIVFVAVYCLILDLRADDRAPQPKPRTALTAVTPVNRNPKRHEELLARKQQGPIGLLFLGASIVEFWPSRGPESWAKFAPYQPADFGVAGECTEDVLWRITNGELDGLNPKVVVIELGGNNLLHPDERPEWVVAGMRKVVNVIHERLPQTKVLLLGIFPRDVKGSRNRLSIGPVNVALARFADGNKTRYLDIGHIFLGANGDLLPDVMGGDRLHPTAKGYELWYEAIRPTLAEWMQ